MDIEQKQAAIIDHFVKKAVMPAVDGAGLASLVAEATSHPSLIAFSEILDSPTISKLDGEEYEKPRHLLSLFVCSTWNDYKSNPGLFPILSSDQVRKLKQLTVLTLVQTTKVLTFDQLMQELDFSSVRELEDFLINECIYAGIVSGKLDSLRKCFEVKAAAARDPPLGELNNVIETLPNWLACSYCMLQSIEEEIKRIAAMSGAKQKHYEEIHRKILIAFKERKSRNDRKLSYEPRVTLSNSPDVTALNCSPAENVCETPFLSALLQAEGELQRQCLQLTRDGVDLTSQTEFFPQKTLTWFVGELNGVVPC